MSTPTVRHALKRALPRCSSLFQRQSTGWGTPLAPQPRRCHLHYAAAAPLSAITPRRGFQSCRTACAAAEGSGSAGEAQPPAKEEATADADTAEAKEGGTYMDLGITDEEFQALPEEDQKTVMEAMQRKKDDERRAATPHHPDARVVITNVDVDLDDEQFLQFLDTIELEGEVLRVQRKRNFRDGTPQPEFFVYFASVEEAQEMVDFFEDDLFLVEKTTWGAHFSPESTVPKLNPPRSDEQKFGLTARYPSEVASAYDEPVGLIEAFDRIAAGASYSSVISAMGLQEDPATEHLFKEWEDRVKLYNLDLSREGMPEEVAAGWDLPPLAPKPPNLIAKEEMLLEKYGPEMGAHLKKRKQYKLPDENIGNVDFVLGDWLENIVATDRTQKITKSGQILSYRTLVTTGNANGTAGFGMGKAATPDLSIKRAFRAAKKNLVYIERYKNRGLTRDLYGEHNNVKVHIYKRPTGSGIKAGKVIEGILEGCGITDVTAKAYGKRNPYSVVRATFNALLEHESLAEVALRRGMRVLSVHKTFMGRRYSDDPKYYYNR